MVVGEDNLAGKDIKGLYQSLGDKEDLKGDQVANVYKFTITVSDPIDVEETAEFIRKEVVEIVHKVDMLYGVQCSLEVKRNGNQ